MILERPENSALVKFLYSKCECYHNFALKAYWSFSSYANDKNPIKREWASKVRDQIMNHMTKEADKKTPSTHSYRKDYISLQNIFITSLISAAVLLGKTEKAKRQEYLQKFFKEQNVWIDRTIRGKKIEGDSEFKAYYRGLVMPFEVGDDNDPRLILRLIPELGHCYSTRQRTPYKIVIETIKLAEAAQWDEKVEEGCKYFPKPGSKMVLMASGDTSPSNRQSTDESEIPLTHINAIKSKPKEVYFQFRTSTDPELSSSKSVHASDTSMLRINKLIKSLRTPKKDHAEGFSTYKSVRTKRWVSLKGMNDPFENDWNQTVARVRESSPYKQFESYSIKAYMVKANDELRQELLAMQFMKKLQSIYQEFDVKIFLRPYEILITSDNSGIIGKRFHLIC
eukprot:TRINITY_DN2996_c0_g1_i1.p1 TRINITY_DN2996_c0_g1~~TRINITY_DN2996_c0_g1_i1.p1  ORF type:complete len:396 (+),score=63.35 TRINITY_DN2996_c0_g1_i1:291-1478(+)